MGCVNGKPVLNAEDLDYIANHTAVSREEVEQSHKNFLEAHPDGKITKSDFRKMMQACYPSTDTEKLGNKLKPLASSEAERYIRSLVQSFARSFRFRSKGVKGPGHYGHL